MILANAARAVPAYRWIPLLLTRTTASPEGAGDGGDERARLPSGYRQGPGVARTRKHRDNADLRPSENQGRRQPDVQGCIERPYRAGRPLRQPYHSFNLMTWMLAGSGIRKIGPRQVRAAANANSAEGNFEACPACSPSQANQSDEVLTRYVSCPAIAWFEPLGAITPRAMYSILPPHAVAPACCKRLRSLLPSSYQAGMSLAQQGFRSPRRRRPVVPMAREVAVAARICSYSSFPGERSCEAHLQATTDAAPHCGQPNPAAGNTSLPSSPLCSSCSLGQEADA